MKKINKALCNHIINSEFITWKFRKFAYKNIGIKIDEKSEIRPGCFFNSKYVQIGKGSFVNYGTQFHSGYNEEAKIIINDNVYVGMNVVFCTISHEIGNAKKRAGESKYGRIIIGEGAWIGANSVILPGVKIGCGCIIGAGSVVKEDCLPNTMYAGNPAVLKKQLL